MDPIPPFAVNVVMGSQHDTAVHETDQVSIHISSQPKQSPVTSNDNSGVDATISKTGVSDVNMNATQASSLEVKREDEDSADPVLLASKYDAWECNSYAITDNHATTLTREKLKKRKTDLDLEASDPLPQKRPCIRTTSEAMAPPENASDVRREADVDTHNSESHDDTHVLNTKRPRTQKRRYRSALRNSEEPKFVTLSDTVGSDGYIKDSFPLHIHSLDMHPDPTDTFMLQYRWDRRQKLWVTDATGTESLPQHILPAPTITADQVLSLVAAVPALFDIYLRVGYSTNFVMSWDDSESCFIIDDPIVWCLSVVRGDV